MATLHSEIIICNNIKLDKNYINVLSYSQSDMLSLCQSNALASDNDYSFIRENGAILVEFPYSTCLQANYMAYQNKDYTNKWFFAFIDKVEYVSEKATRIYFTIDAWSTFYDDWSSNSVFVHREHVSDDTFGLHTLPEGLETGEYVNVESPVSTSVGSDISICVATSKSIYYDNNDNKWHGTTPSGQLINGIYQGLQFAVFSDYPSWASGIKKKEIAVNNYMYFFSHGEEMTQDDIIDIFMIPTSILGNNYEEVTYQYSSGTLPIKAKILNDSVSEIILERYLIRDNYNLAGGYQPHNKKLLCFPYRYILASNGTGQDVVYNWEDFTHENDMIGFNSHGDLTPNCSIKCIPQKYKGLNNNYEEAINFSKYPTCSWIYDAYTNWMTQNNVNCAVRTIGGLVKVGTGLAGMMSGAGTMAGGFSAGDGDMAVSGYNGLSDSAGGLGSGVGSILGVAMEQYQHQFDPNQARGNINCGDVNFTITKNEIQFYKMSIKPEYARVLDGIFNRFGYIVNTFKHPNITGRTYWNYVQVTSGEKTVNGNIPNNYIDEINRAFERGVTIWHDHSNLGDFSLNNSI